MRHGDINSSDETVGTAVVNYDAPHIESHEELIDNTEKIVDTMRGMKRGWPGLDLAIFPEYSTQGILYDEDLLYELSIDLDSSEVIDILAEGVQDVGVWGVFSITGEEHEDHPDKPPYNTYILMNPDGEIVQRYRKIIPWTPVEPWYPGDEVKVAEGPKGLKISLIICDDGNYPEIWREAALKGAELTIRGQGYMYPAREQQRMVAQTSAWQNNMYVAVANMGGSDGVYSYFGHSSIIGPDGRVLGETESGPMERQYAELDVEAIRDLRETWTAQNHLFKLGHRGYTGTRMADEDDFGHSELPFSVYEEWANRPEEFRDRVEDVTGIDEEKGIEHLQDTLRPDIPHSVDPDYDRRPNE